jgi:predicted AlkP superfamily phosphohydrolase/phosphomutase
LIKDISRHLTVLAPGGTLDWSQTVAFSPWNAQQGVRLNVRGREAQGRVEPGVEYEVLRDRIHQALLTCAEPKTGRRVIDQVWRREEIYDGPRLESMPDLVFALRPGFASSPLQPGLWDSTGWATGDHSLEGLTLARGAGIVPGSLEGAALVDVAPMALYLLGQSVPEAIDGRVWREVLDPAWLAARPVCRAVGGEAPAVLEEAGPVLSRGEAAELEDRLRGLGYL